MQKIDEAIVEFEKYAGKAIADKARDYLQNGWEFKSLDIEFDYNGTETKVTLTLENGEFLAELAAEI